jgi:hypothetical protein
MKKKLIYLSLTISSLLLTNCSVEEKIVENSKQSHVKISEKTFDELIKNEIFNSAYSKISKPNNLNNNSIQGKTVMEDQYGFTISDQPATVLEETNKTSYTFLVTRDNLVHNYFENLVFEIDSTNSTKAILIKYNLTNEIQYGLPHSSFNFQYQTEITPIVYNSNQVNSKTSYIECFTIVTHLCDWGGATHIAGANCTTTYFGAINICNEVDGTPGGGGVGYGGGTGGGASNSISTTPVTNYYYYTVNPNNPDSNYLDLTSSQIAWLNSQTIELRKSILSYFTPLYEGELSASWTINYLILNSNTSFQQFQNQFMGTTEGTDGEYDAAYWDNPNLTFPPQNLPTWANFQNAFPLDSDPLYNTPLKMYNSIGGDVATYYSGPNTNTCAIRLSKALNYSGVTIPNIPNQTFRGEDNKYYFKAAYQINLWMRKTFGTNPASTLNPVTSYNSNHHQYTQAQAGVHGVNLPALLNGKHGIYSIYSSNFAWASGHADLLNSNATCGNHCLFYEAPIYRLDIWELN